MYQSVLYKVEQQYVYGWDDAGWEENEKPWRFKMKKSAQKAINDFIKECDQAVKNGDMEESYLKEEFRVVPVKKNGFGGFMAGFETSNSCKEKL